MNSDPRRTLLVTPLLLLAFLHCNLASAHDIYVLGTSNNIALVPESQPALAATTVAAVTGLVAGDLLVAIDVRPQNAQLYGLGFNSGAGTVQLYHIAVDDAGARAFALGANVGFVSGAGVSAPVTGSAFDMEFNPATDRIRVVDNTGQNFRINPNTGAAIDGDLGGPAGSVTGVNMDGSVNGATNTLDGAAYTNNISNVSVATLYTLDSNTNSLYIQNPPNTGTQTLPITVTLAGSTLDFGSESGFDIPTGVNVVASGTAATGEAVAALSVGGISGLYRLNLATGVARSLGSFGLTARDIAIAPETQPAIALAGDGTSLLRFQVPKPDTTSTVAISGIVAGERLVGIDGRPATGQLFGIGVDATSDKATTYLIDPQTGAATIIGSAGLIAFVAAGGNPVDFPDASWGIDFNPTVDRLRVVSSANGLNFRVNPNTGAPVDGDLGGTSGSVSGVNPDAFINGAVGVGISGAAYTNNIFGATVTTLYTLDSLGNRLFIQNPANFGTQTSPVTLTLNGSPFDFDTVAGFDIPPGVDAPVSSGPATGEGFAALGTGTTSLYRINLSTGAVAPIGLIGAGGAVAGLVIWTSNDRIFQNGFE
ncbi:MAG: DUF4394 domain-containing protein [Rudaea sp.]